MFLVIAAACHDGLTQPRPQGPLVGQWMLETHFDTFMFTTPPTYVDCYNMGDYCSHARTTVDSAFLGGMLQVKDSLGLTGIKATSVQITGTLTQRFCDSVDYDKLTGCTHVGPAETGNYLGEIQETPGSMTTNVLTTYISEVIPGTLAGRGLSAWGATYAGDSIYGRLYWGVPGHGPEYSGTFVMRRVR